MVFRVYEKDSPISERSLVRLAKIGVATVHESMEVDRLLDRSLVPMTPGTSMAGHAVTIHMAPGHNLGVHVGLQVSKPGDVLVMVGGSTHDQPACGMWGELATRCALQREVAGIVADGCVRDSAAFRALNFPVWARGLSPRSGDKRALTSVNAPVSCGGVVVNPGDVVVADDDGIVVLRPSEVDHVLAAASQRLEFEERVKKTLATGEATTFTALGLQDLVESGDLVFERRRWAQED